MSTPFRTFVFTEALGVAALNAGLNAALGWWSWRSLGPLTLFGENGIGADLATTPPFIGLLSTLLGTHLVRRKLGDGRVAVPSGAHAPAALRSIPKNILTRAATIGVVCEVMLGVPLWLLLRSAEFGVLSLAEACAAKAAITVLLSVVIVPLMILCALADVQHRSSRAAFA